MFHHVLLRKCLLYQTIYKQQTLKDDFIVLFFMIKGSNAASLLSHGLNQAKDFVLIAQMFGLHTSAIEYSFSR